MSWADTGQIKSIELGFLNGREEPELIVRDQPSQGSVFPNDAISWKVRHVFGRMGPPHDDPIRRSTTRSVATTLPPA